jgi:hypothetical protein
MKPRFFSTLCGVLLAAILTLNISISFVDGNPFLLNSKAVFGTEIEPRTGVGQPNQECFVGVTNTSGTSQKYWCGDCAKHYVYSETGDGKCTRKADDK